MRKLLIALVVFPVAAFAQSAGQPAGKQPQDAPPAQQGQAGKQPQNAPPSQGQPGMQRGPGMGQGPGRQGWIEQRKMDPKRFERRMRLARTLGLAEALDLEPADALKLGDQLAKNDDKRLAIHQQLRDSNQVLMRAAGGGERASAAEVDGAIQRILQARTQLEALDREAVQTVVKDLTPEKRARAMLFLERFHNRFRPGHGGPGGPGQVRDDTGVGGGRGPGHGGMGRMRGMGMGPGQGMDPEMMAGACPGPDCMDDEEP